MSWQIRIATESNRGMIPFVCEYWEGKPLFIVDGNIFSSSLLTGHENCFFPIVHGIAYSYENFPWPLGKKVSKEECRKVAEENNQSYPELWVTCEVYRQFKEIYKP